MALPTDLPTLQPRPAIDAGGATAIGQVRERNEDQFLVARVQHGLEVTASSLGQGTVATSPGQAAATLLVVADGMGGLSGGDVASAVAVQTVAEQLGAFVAPSQVSDGRASLPGVREKLVSAVGHGNESVQRAASEGGGKNMGTTLTIAYVSFPTLYIAHVGDSRCYLHRGGKLYQLTHDHTVAEEMHKQLGEEVPANSQWHHVLTRAIGPSENTEATPEVRRLPLGLGDALLLCSDGVTKHLSDEDLAGFLQQDERAEAIARRIVAEADARGGKDNITAVVARFVSGSPGAGRAASGLGRA